MQKLLQISVAVFFLILGILGITDHQESIFSLNDANQNLEIVFGVLEVLSAAVLLGALFVPIQRRTRSLALLTITIFWTARIVISRFPIQQAVWSDWAVTLAAELVVLCAVLSLSSRTGRRLKK